MSTYWSFLTILPGTLRLSKPRISQPKPQPEPYLTISSVTMASQLAFTVIKFATLKARLLRSCVPLLVLISRGLPLITRWSTECQNDLIKHSLICSVLLKVTKSLTGSRTCLAYKSTCHKSTGYLPHYLMFGRHPRLAVDAFLGIKPGPERSDKSKYVTHLKKRLEFAYKAASKEVRRQGRRHKMVYGLRVREWQLQPGDRVLIQNVGVRWKRKIADRWEKDVYLVVDQPNKGIPGYLLKREHGRGRWRMLHRNLLLPFMALPESKPDLLDTSIPTESIQPLPVDTTTSVDNTNQDDLAEGRSEDTGDVGTQAAIQPDKYVIPQRRPGFILDPTAKPFNPRFPDSAHGVRPRVLPSRSRQMPPLQTSGLWVI